MKVDRRGDSNGGIYDTIKLTVDEEAALDRCHEILRQRFANEGEPYDRAQKEICEWWLMGLLRFEGTEKMEKMAKNAPFPKRSSDQQLDILR